MSKDIFVQATSAIHYSGCGGGENTDRPGQCARSPRDDDIYIQLCFSLFCSIAMCVFPGSSKTTSKDCLVSNSGVHLMSNLFKSPTE
jgi:hypothetical protein